jgi:cytochrome oxidase Cu insertion factor (SCO1/SenC/PrrC family)
VKGERIEPARSLPDINAIQEDASQLNLLSLKGQWLLISVDSGSCDQACQDRLYIQRQLIVSLGKERERVDWVWMVKDQAPIAQEIKPALVQARILRVPQAALRSWLLNESEGQEKKEADRLEDYFYLVDPMGQLMERFKAGQGRESALHVKKDMDRLLRASSAWDKAGR